MDISRDEGLSRSLNDDRFISGQLISLGKIHENQQLIFAISTSLPSRAVERLFPDTIFTGRYVKIQFSTPPGLIRQSKLHITSSGDSQGSSRSSDDIPSMFLEVFEAIKKWMGKNVRVRIDIDGIQPILPATNTTPAFIIGRKTRSSSQQPVSKQSSSINKLDVTMKYGGYIEIARPKAVQRTEASGTRVTRMEDDWREFDFTVQAEDRVADWFNTDSEDNREDFDSRVLSRSNPIDPVAPATATTPNGKRKLDPVHEMKEERIGKDDKENDGTVRRAPGLTGNKKQKLALTDSNESNIGGGGNDAPPKQDKKQKAKGKGKGKSGEMAPVVATTTGGGGKRKRNKGGKKNKSREDQAEEVVNVQPVEHVNPGECEAASNPTEPLHRADRVSLRLARQSKAEAVILNVLEREKAQQAILDAEAAKVNEEAQKLTRKVQGCQGGLIVPVSPYHPLRIAFLSV